MVMSAEGFQSFYNAHCDQLITALVISLFLCGIFWIFELIISDIRQHEQKQKNYKLK